MISRGRDESKFKLVAAKLLNGEPLEPRHEDHPLKGSVIGWRDCHIEPTGFWFTNGRRPR